LIPNETEAETIAGMPVTNLEEARACARHLVAAGFPRVVITLGANGALAANADGDEHIAPYPVEAVDTTGAGDAFIGSFACFLGSGMAEREAIARANVYAALSTLRPGTQISFASHQQFAKAWASRSA
jgi:ribokinase